jgi:hypothetical protein
VSDSLSDCQLFKEYPVPWAKYVSNKTKDELGRLLPQNHRNVKWESANYENSSTTVITLQALPPQ